MTGRYLRKRILSSILALIFLPAVFAQAQQNQAGALLDIPRGSAVVLKIPGKLIGFERISTWSGNVSYGALIEPSKTSGVMIGGLTEWRTSGWPLMRQLTLEKISREKNYTLVELADPLFNVKLRFDGAIGDLNASFREVAFPGQMAEFEASDYYQKEVVGKILPKVFDGDLASITTERKLNLLKELRYVDSAIRSEKYKGNTFLSVNVGQDTEVYNTLRVDQTHRIGHSLNQRVLSYFKRIARIIKFHPQIDGVKISIQVPYKNFITEAYSEPSYDRVEIYAPMEIIRQFADSELTNQDFINESIMLVNGARVNSPQIESL